MVYVNNEPCYYVDNSNSNQYVIARYSYTFLDEDLKELCTDTLTFNFAFYTNSTYLSVKTEGGAEAVKYWNYYFNKNVFEVRIEKTDYVFDNEITFGDGDISRFYTIKYYIDEEIYLTTFFDSEKPVILVSPLEKTGHVFCYWVDESNNIVEDSSFFTTDISLYAVYIEAEVLDDFVFKGNSLSSYEGNEENVVVPESYSLLYGEFVVGGDIVVEEIQNMCFYNKDKIKTITLPKTLKKLGFQFMWGLDSLEKLIITSDEMPEFDRGEDFEFGNAGGDDFCLIYVNDHLIETYKIRFPYLESSFYKISEL